MRDNRLVSVGVLFVAGMGLSFFSCPSHAVQEQDIKKTIGEIATAFQKGPPAQAKAQAKKLAVAAAKKLDEINDVMLLFRPPAKGGLGDKDGYTIAAIAEVTLARPPLRDQGKKTKKAWAQWSSDLRDAGLALAQAKGAQQIKAATAKVKTICVNCHAVFKD